MAQAKEDASSTLVQAVNSNKAQACRVGEPRAEPRPASGIGRVVDPTTLLIMEPGGPMLFFAGTASATSGDGLVPDQLDEEAEHAEPGYVGKAQPLHSVQ